MGNVIVLFGQSDLRRRLRRPRIIAVLRAKNGVDLPSEETEKIFDIKPVPHRSERHQIFFCQSKQTHRRVHPPPILRVGRPRMLFLQMDEPASGLDEALEIIRVLRFRPQPKMLEYIVRFVVALLIPATKKAEVTGMLRDFASRFIRRRAAQLFDQPGNSLAFVHRKINFVSAEMTGNRARIVFPTEGWVRTAAGDG
jgi:hypothetical protein